MARLADTPQAVGVGAAALLIARSPVRPGRSSIDRTPLGTPVAKAVSTTLDFDPGARPGSRQPTVVGGWPPFFLRIPANGSAFLRLVQAAHARLLLLPDQSAMDLSTDSISLISDPVLFNEEDLARLCKQLGHA